MKNLFENMGKPDAQWEDVEESTLPCQDRTCTEVVTRGRYSEPLKILTWKCNQGHVSKLENFNI